MIGINTTNIPSRDGAKKRVKKDYNTDDIISAIIETDKINDNRFCEFSKQFSRDRKGLKKLWSFVRYQIKYKEDPSGSQLVKTPAALWSIGIGDCKSKTIFINQVLRCLNIPYIIRFTSYSGDPNPTHVYSVAVLDGQKIIIDTVYHTFGNEKQYRTKKDFFFSMDKGLYKISGIDSNPDIQKRLIEIKQKQEMLPQQEFIPFSKLTAGQAQLLLLKRAMEVKRVMKPENAKVYKEALSVIDAEMAAATKGKFHEKGFAKRGSFSDTIYPVLQKLRFIKGRRQKAMQKPTILAKSTVQGKRSISGTWVSNTQYQKDDGIIVNLPPDPGADVSNILASTPTGNADIPYLFDNNGTYIFGKNSQYRKTLESVVDPETGQTLWQAYGDLVAKYIDEKMMDGNSVITAPYSVPVTTAYGVQMVNPTFSKIRSPLAQQWAACRQNPVTLQTSTTCAALTFANPSTRTEFVYDLRSASGIMDDYMNDIFANANQIGNGFIYGFLGDAGLSLNDVPLAVASKYATHAGYISGAANFCGVDDFIIKDLGFNNIIYTNGGESPENILQALRHQNQRLQSQQAAIGEPISATIAAIVSAIIAIVPIIENVMRLAKRESELIDPTNLPDSFKPIGEPLMLSQDDWTGTDGTGGNDNNNGGGSGSNNTGLILGGLGAAWLAYNQFKKD